jgi:hypothetical protein
MRAPVELGGHTLRFRMPSVPARIAWYAQYERAAEDTGDRTAAVFAALQVAWDATPDAPPWPAAKGAIAQGLAIAEAVAGWKCGAIAVYNVADEVAVAIIDSLHPPKEAEVEAARDFSPPTSASGTATDVAPPATGTGTPPDGGS